MKITDIITEAANSAQQAAIAISMKKAGKNPRSVDEDLTRRGFLRGLGAAAVAGAAGSALAGTDDLDFPNKVQKMHSDMMEKNPRYAKEHEALGIALARGFVGAAAENNKRWYQKTAELLQKYGVKVNEGVAEGSLEELSTGLLQRAAQVAKDKRNKAMDPKIHNALGGGYMNPLAKHYDTVSQKLSNKAAKAGQQDAIEKIASPAVMRKMGMSGKGATEGVAEDTELAEEFDLIESIVEMIAEHNGVDAEVVWADLESLTEDELYVFAVTSDPLMEDWQKANKRDKTDGMSQKAVNAYRRENPGSKLKTAVTTKPGKLKKGGKASKRRKSYCSRSRGQMKMHSISCAKTPDKAICKARRRWNC